MSIRKITLKTTLLSTAIGMLAGGSGLVVANTNLADFTLEEVVVTAQKRSQSLQDVGVAVNAFNDSDIRELGMGNVADIASQSPNVTIKQYYGNSFPVITIRGVGMNYFGSNSASASAVHVDEVYVGSPALLGFQLFDIERLEVLKGPQGTLYGRNTTAGTVNFVSGRPTEETTGYLDLSVAEYDSVKMEGAVSGSLNDSIRGRLSGIYEYGDGHQKNRLTGNYEGGADRVALRGILDWDVSEDLSANFVLRVGQDKSEVAQFQHRAGGVGAEVDDNGRVVDVNGYRDDDNDPHAGEWNYAGNYDKTMAGGAVTLNLDLDGVTLTSITAYDKLDQDYVVDEDSSPYKLVDQIYSESFSQWSQELRLTSDNLGNFSWIVGAYIAGDTVDFFRDADLSEPLGVMFFMDASQDTKAQAAFAHTEWKLADDWKLTGGLRYTKESKGFSFINYLLEGDRNTVPIESGPNANVSPRTDKKLDDSWTDVSGKIALDWTPSDDWLFYLSYSKGFKSGGYPAGLTLTPDAVVSFDPEYVYSTEFGFKSTLMGGRMRLNGAIFNYDYEDKQENTFIFVDGAPIGAQILTNAGDVKVQGAELDATFRATEALDVIVGLSVLNSEVKEFFNPAVVGNELPNAPEFTFNGRLRYAIPMASGNEVALSTDFSYTGDQYFEVNNDSQMAQDGYWLLNTRAELTTADGNWSAALWGRNLLDEEYLANSFSDEIGFFFDTYGAPRTIGASFRRNF